METISAESIGVKIAAELQFYNDDIKNEIQGAVDDVAKNAKKAIIDASSVSRDFVYTRGGKIHRAGTVHTGGNYKKGWAISKGSKENAKYEIVIYNKTHAYLVHILEHGRRGGIGARPHAAAVQNSASNELTARLSDILGAW